MNEINKQDFPPIRDGWVVDWDAVKAGSLFPYRFVRRCSAEGKEQLRRRIMATVANG